MYQQPIQKLVDLVKAAYEKNQAMNLEVFVHKADVLTEEYKIGPSPAVSALPRRTSC